MQRTKQFIKTQNKQKKKANNNKVGAKSPTSFLFDILYAMFL